MIAARICNVTYVCDKDKHTINYAHHAGIMCQEPDAWPDRVPAVIATTHDEAVVLLRRVLQQHLACYWWKPDPADFVFAYGFAEFSGPEFDGTFGRRYPDAHSAAGPTTILATPARTSRQRTPKTGART